MKVIVDFRNIEDAHVDYNDPNEKILKIYGRNEYLLWENPNPLPPIEKQSDCFIFMEDPYDYEYFWYPNEDDMYKGTIITGNYVVPHIYNGHNVSSKNTQGTTWWPKLSSSLNDKFKESVAGVKYNNRFFQPGFFQFVKFKDYTGIYLYAPEFKVIVANDSEEKNWTYTTDINNGFDITQYLNYDPFSDDESTWTTVNTTYKKGKHHYEEPSDITFATDYIYKEFNFVEWPTVIIWAGGYTPTIHDFFGYDDGTHVVRHSRCMVKPKLQSDRERWGSFIGDSIRIYPKFVQKITSTKGGTGGIYNAILPIKDDGWQSTSDNP